ncbi:MAG TPA: tetratricopeptide repeat protein [Verrucomicrobiae bacterium]
MLICLALVLATFATYWRVSGNDFINIDDGLYVKNNPWVNHGLSFAGVSWAFTHFYSHNWHPLTWISHMLDCQLFGLQPGPQHMVNVGFHAANAVLLFLLLNRLTSALWRSAIVAGFFALHPLHVESVAWIAERKDVLSAFFGLLALLAYTRYTEDLARRDLAKDAKPWRWYGFALIFFVLSLMSKPMLVTLPFVMLLLDYWPLRRLSKPIGDAGSVDHRSMKSLLLEKCPFFVLVVASCVVTYQAQHSSGAVVESQSGVYVGNALISYLRYLERMFWPMGLCMLYPFSPISAWHVVCALSILLAVSVFCVAMAKHRPYLAVGWFWYLGTLVPAIGFLQVGPQSSADRYTYIPLVGVFIVCVWGAADLMSGWKFQKQVATLASMLLLAMCSAMTVHQLQFWKNGITLLGRTLAVTANNASAQDKFAEALIAAGEGGEALTHDAEAVRLDPANAVLQNDYASALDGAGRQDDALAHYAEAARLAPNNALIQNNYGVALVHDGQTNAAIARYEMAIRLQTNYADAYNNLGAALTGTGRFAEAASAVGQAVNFEPDNPAVRVNFGLALLRLGRVPDAAQQFAKAVSLAPDLPQAQYQLGLGLAIMRQPADALRHLQEASRLRPYWPDPLNATAWILATDGDAQIRNGPEAVKLAENAATLSMWKDPVILNTLAAAYAEAGRFDDAAKTAAQAVTLAKKSGQNQLATQIQALQALYQQHQAFHHP